jgi:deaminated glutathione amidase
MKIGMVQMNTQSDKQANLECCVEMIARSAQENAELVVLPEFFNYLGPESDMIEQGESLAASPSLKCMAGEARKHKIHLYIGSILERDADKLYNTGVVFNPLGELIAKYRKIHLFDVEIPGGRRYFESELITPGDTVTTFEIHGVVFGMSTCYDLRFPELFRKLIELGAQVLLVPAAFTMETGRDHWELLLRARAVENLCWVVGVNQCGKFPPNHNSYGRSMVVDPWGVVVGRVSDGVQCLTVDIDFDLQRDIRQRFPALDHIREKIFSS